MRRSSTLLVLLALALAACGGSTGPDGSDSSTPPRLSVEPSSQLSRSVGSGDFSWSQFQEQVSLRLVRGQYADDLKLCAVQVVGDEVRDSDCSPSLETSSAELSAGVTSGDLIPSDAPPFAPGEQWFPLEEWAPAEFVIPSDFNFPRQNNVVNAMQSQVSLGQGEGMVIVFAATGDPFIVPGEVPFQVKPFGLKVARQPSQ